MARKKLYLMLAILGTVVPWTFFFRFFAIEGVNLPLFLQSLFVNGAASGFAADVLISILVFLIWSFFDAKKHGIKKWWWVLPANLSVGLSLALPLYLYLREGKVTQRA